MNSKVYKWCVFPQCGNSSLKTPNKLFISVPNNKTTRYKWLNLARRDPKAINLKSPIYFCEDHFDITTLIAEEAMCKTGFEGWFCADNVLSPPILSQFWIIFKQRMLFSDCVQNIKLTNCEDFTLPINIDGWVKERCYLVVAPVALYKNFQSIISIMPIPIPNQPSEDPNFAHKEALKTLLKTMRRLRLEALDYVPRIMSGEMEPDSEEIAMVQDRIADARLMFRQIQETYGTITK